MNKTTFTFSVIAALALGLVGCGDSSSNNGTGGTGGTPSDMAMVRVAHLGTDLPTAENTAVDVTVDGDVAIEGLTFAQSTGFVSLPAGEHTFGINVAGTDTEVFSVTTTLPADSITTVVAISSVNVDDDDQDVLNVLVFDGDLSELAEGSGRVLVGHGFDAEGFENVDVILPATCPMNGALVPDLMFATVRDVADLPANDYVVGIAAPDSCDSAVGPLTAPVTADVATLLIAAADETGTPQVYAIVGDFSSGDDMTPIPTLPPATPETAQVRIAHLAPEVPAPGDTNVDILVNGNTEITNVEFREATGFVELPVGDYTFGIAPAGTGDPVFEFTATLEANAILTVVAYRTVASGAADPVGVLVFDGSTDGLPIGTGRVIVGHGADDSLLDPVNVLDTGDCPEPLLPNFEFGAVSTSLDLDIAGVNIAFNLPSSPECRVDAGPLAAPITDDVVTLLVAVDNDVDDGSLAPAVYAIIGDFAGNDIPALEAP